MPWDTFKQMGPKPSDPVEFALYQFAGLAGHRAAHPRDWDRFYRFVAMAHARRKGWDACDVMHRLKRYGFSKEVSEMLAEAYWHGRCALYARNYFGLRHGHVRWMRRDGTCLT